VTGGKRRIFEKREGVRTGGEITNFTQASLIHQKNQNGHDFPSRSYFGGKEIEKKRFGKAVEGHHARQGEKRTS